MIVFDLKCSGGHVFEAWFGSTDDFDAQRARGLVECPLCGDGAVDKAVMAPAVAAKGNQRAAAIPDAATRLLAMQRAIEAQSDWVGDRFAAEARTLHARGETRSIHGEATPAEARALLADGVPVMPMPFTPLAKSDA